MLERTAAVTEDFLPVASAGGLKTSVIVAMDIGVGEEDKKRGRGNVEDLVGIASYLCPCPVDVDMMML